MKPVHSTGWVFVSQEWLRSVASLLMRSVGVSYGIGSRALKSYHETHNKEDNYENNKSIFTIGRQ